MLSKFTKILIVSFAVMIISPVVSFGQTVNLPYALSGELGFDIEPIYPRPNQNVSILLTLYTDNLNSADIAWYKDGKNVLSGKGETNYSFTAGSTGEETNIEVRIKLLNGVSFSKSVTLNPASVDLVWEADSYVAPFYRGKALYPRQGRLKIVATPEFVKNGRRISPSNLIYKWSNRVEGYQNQSGYGKNTIILDGSMLGRAEWVEVLVTDPVDKMTSQGFINISPVDPEIVFYENNSYYGHIFDKSISNEYDLKTGEVQILAVPYYFTRERDGLLKYEWRLNGAPISNLSDIRTAIFRKPENKTGRSTISLAVENLNRILQQADASIDMIFKN